MFVGLRHDIVIISIRDPYLCNSADVSWRFLTVRGWDQHR